MMLKPDQSSAEEPKDDSERIDDQGPSFEELMMLVFSGPIRFEGSDEAEEEAEMAAEEETESEDEKSNS